MNGQIQTELPFWLALIGLMLAIFLSWYSYAGNRNTEFFTRAQRIFLMIIRGLGIFLISILILGFFFKSTKKSKLKPNYLIVIDNSQSMAIGKDSLLFAKDVFSLNQRIEKILSNKYQVSTYQIGSELLQSDSLNFKHPLTDFQGSLEQLFVNYSQADIREMLILSDGIPTTGPDLKSVLSRWPYPVSIIAFGDSISGIDTKIQELLVSDIAYQNSKFPVEFIFSSDQLLTKTLRFRLLHKDITIIDSLISIDSVDGIGSLKLSLAAGEPGIHIYESILDPVEDEINTINNKRSFVIEVLEKKNKILLLYDQPHPDLAVLSNIIESTGDFELTLWPLSKGKPEIDEYVMAILYQLPSVRSVREGFLIDILESDLGLLFVVGPTTDLNQLNLSLPEIEMTADRLVLEDFGAYINDQFDLFHFPAGISDYLNIVPPLKGQLASINLDNQSFVLLHQKIKNIDMHEPLVWFSRTASKKIGFWWGEGIWRWNTFEYLYFDDHFFTESLIRSIVAFLSISDVDDPLKIDVPRTISSFESLNWIARLYNESWELTNDPTLYMVLRNPSGELRKFEFRRSDNYYWMDIEDLIAGKYEYRCYTYLSGEEISKSGAVEVLDIPNEGLDTKARITEMKAIADQKGGRFFRFNEQIEIEDYMANIESTNSSEYLETKWNSLLDWHLLLFIVVGIFMLEWILRRFLGTR